MDVTLLYFDGCPNWEQAADHLETLAQELPELSVSRRRVETVEDAEQVGFHGSPTILIGGVDPFAPGDATVGLSCRIYSTPDGRFGSPTLEQLLDAVASHG